MATSIFDHPVILIVVVAASILRWLWQKSQTEKPDSERPVIPEQPIPRGGATQTEEERIRRFLEALGQPPGSAPPKVATRRRVDPRMSPPLPGLTTVPPPLPPALPVAAARLTPAPARIFKPAIAQESGFEVHDLATQTSSEPAPEDGRPGWDRAGFGFKLNSTQNLRDAIVLREIFGPPRSLQPPDLVSGF